MQLEEYVRQVQDQLAATAALGDERAQQIAARLADAAAPAVRLAILAALSEAADEITAALLDSPGSPAVSVRLDGGDSAMDVRVDVTGGEPQPCDPGPARADESEASARISLRLPESLKADVEQAAATEGVSVNTWLVRAANSGLRTSWPGFGGATGFAPARGGQGNRRHPNSHHVSGWING